MAEPPVEVWKVGGSLFELPELGERLSTLIAQRRPRRALLIAGGGPAADVVRRWDAVHLLGDEAAHSLALRAMSLGEDLLHTLLPDTVPAASRADAEAAWNGAKTPILRSAEFLRSEERVAESRLPHNWHVTSDSIAAWVAWRWPAGELLLLKSVAVDEAASSVDEEFAAVAGRLPRLSWVNLRDESPRSVGWNSGN